MIATGRFEVYKDNQGEWRWRYKARNNETISVSSEGYNDKRDAVHSINLMKESYSAKVEDNEIAS